MVDRESDATWPEGRQPDVVVFGPPDGSGRPERRRHRWLALPLVLVVAVVAVAVVRAVQATPASVTPAPRPSTALGLPPLSEASGPDEASPGPAVTEAGRPLLGVTGGWELFGRGPDALVRVELARGRVTRTFVPALASDGPVSFIAGPDWAIIRPLDQVPGYLVRDGRVAQPLAGALGPTGPALPGPDQAHVWAAAGGDDRTRMILVDGNGRPTGVSVPIPATMAGFAEPDGAGYLLLYGPGGVYDARPAGIRRITTGTVLAAGPTRWLALECDAQAHCGNAVIDRDTGARHSLAGPPIHAGGATGVISPDGALAVLPGPDASGIRLLDLSSGADRRVDGPASLHFEDATMVWSPDSRWLFMTGAGGRLYPVEPASGKVHDLGVPLPPMTQLAIRTAS